MKKKRRGITKVPKILIYLLYGKVGVERTVGPRYIRCRFKNKDVYKALHLSLHEFKCAVHYIHDGGYGNLIPTEPFYSIVDIPIPKDQEYVPRPRSNEITNAKV